MFKDMFERLGRFFYSLSNTDVSYTIPQSLLDAQKHLDVVTPYLLTDRWVAVTADRRIFGNENHDDLMIQMEEMGIPSDEYACEFI